MSDEEFPQRPLRRAQVLPFDDDNDDEQDEFDREEQQALMKKKAEAHHKSSARHIDDDEDVESDDDGPLTKARGHRANFIDSEDEDEDELDQEMADDQDGFIVDDDEVEEEVDDITYYARQQNEEHRRRESRSGSEKVSKEGEDSEDGSQDSSHERRRQKKLKRKKKRFIEDGEWLGVMMMVWLLISMCLDNVYHTEEEDLDEEEIALLEENLGVQARRPENQLKRLKKGRRDWGDSASASRHTDLEALFEDRPTYDGDGDSGDEMGHRGKSRHLDDMEDFIEDESDEDDDTMHHRRSNAGGFGHGALDDEEMTDVDGGHRRYRRERHRTGGIEDAVDDMADVFGTGYEWALEDDEEQGNEDGEGDGYDGYGGGYDTIKSDRHRPKLKDVFEPSELEERMMTEIDDEIRLRDVPERLQASLSVCWPDGPDLTIYDYIVVAW
jgi:transcription elongation factor SPT6